MRDIMRFRVLAMVLLALGLFAGSFASVGAQATPGTDEPGSVVISKFVCTQIEEPTATISDPVGVGALPPDDEEGCSVDSANFEIYLNSDFTSDPIEVFVDGTATVDGIPATVGTPHALFEPAFNVFFEFEVTPGGVTTITVLNPADDGDGATPVGDDSDAGDGVADDGTGDDGVADDGTGDDGTGDDAADDDGAGDDDGAAQEGDQEEAEDVSGLPSTGQGSDGGASGSALVLLFGAVSMVALAAGFAWRQRRSA